MEYSQSYTEPKLIDFFKSEMPLRKDRDMGKQTYMYRPGNQQLGTGYQGKGASQEPAIADSGRLKLEPSSGIVVDFLSGNGDPNHQLDAAVSRSSSAANEVKHPMALESKEAGGEWSLVARPNLPNLALKLLSPTSTGTEGSGTSAPKTPIFDIEMNSRRIPDQYEYSLEGSTFSDDSGRFRAVPDVVGQHGSSRHGDRKLHKKEQFNGEVGSRVYRWSPDSCTSYGRLKRLKRITSRVPTDDNDTPMVEENSNPRTRDVSTQTQISDPSQTRRKLRKKDSEELEDDVNQAVVQAATSLLSLSSNEADWQPSTKLPSPNVSSSSSLAAVAETDRESGRESGEAVPASSSVGCSSVLSRPSNKRRYRLVVDLLAESPRVR